MLVIIAAAMMAPGTANASAASMSIALSSSSIYTYTEVDINVSGDAPSGAFLEVLVKEPTETAEIHDTGLYHTVELTSVPAEKVEAGSFGKTFSVVATSVGEYTVSAYLYSNEAREETLAASEAHFDASKPTASLSITPTPTNILAGRPVELTVTGSSDVAATISGSAGEPQYGENHEEKLGEQGACLIGGEWPEGCTGTQVGPGAFTLHLRYVPSGNGPATINFSIERSLPTTPSELGSLGGGEEGLQGATIALPRAPLPIAELESPAEAWTTTPGTSMSFSWSAAPFGEDMLTIKSAKPNDEAEYLVTEKGFKYLEAEPKWLPLRKLGIWTTDAKTGITTVKIKPSMSLFPGNYVWQVRRTSGSEKVMSPRHRFVVTRPPVKRLYVRALTHHGATSRHPGYTNLSIQTTPYASVMVKLTHESHTSTEQWSSRSGASVTPTMIQWSCQRPAGIYKYVVTARGGSGSTLTRRGRFSTVTTTRCASMEQREARERAARRQQEERRAARQQRESTERFEKNCRAIGGTPVTVQTSAGGEVVCRSPLGGTLPVPM